MPINSPTDPQTALRTPRLRILADGKPLPGAISAEVESNNFFQTDHFSAEFAVSAGPPGWFDRNPPWVVDIQFSLEGAAWTSLIIGEVDEIDLDLPSQILRVEGRDLSAKLTEGKTQASYRNQTSSEIVTTIVGRHPEITRANITPTSTMVSRYYEQDHTQTSSENFGRLQTDWDVIVELARLEGFDVFMQGRVLHFQPAVSPDSDPFLIQWTPPGPVPRLNVESLRLRRRMTHARPVRVVVRSWNSRQGRGFTKVFETAPAAASGNPTEFFINRPNLTEDQAIALAEKTATEHAKHERPISVRMPGDLTLTPRNMVRIGGTGLSWDQVFFIDSIHRSLRFDGGFEQSLALRNTSPRTQQVIQ